MEALMKSLSCFACLCALSATALMPLTHAEGVYDANSIKITVDGRGQLVSLLDVLHNKELLAPGQPAPMASVKIGDVIEAPSSAEFQQDPRGIRLLYSSSGVAALIAVQEKETHISFELVQVEPADRVDAIIWGPFPVSINQTVGEVVGVVRDKEYAIGLQALNVKTVGGYPDNAEGLSGFRGQTAVAHPWGSILQAYSLDRSRPRAVAAWSGHFPNMPVPPIEGETVVGSKIALFGCAASDALDVIGAIEIAEGLPHPQIDGVWSKKSPEA